MKISYTSERSTLQDFAKTILFGTALVLIFGTATQAETIHEFQKLTASDGDMFGLSVSISGDTAIVGAGGYDSSSASVFANSGGTWSQVAKLTASDAAEGDLFGVSVSISGDTAIVGASFGHTDSSDSGSAYIFANSGGIWSEVAKLTASDVAEGDVFGRNVSISGNIAIVGAHKDDDAGSNSGSAYVFSNSGGTWSQVAKLTASDAAEGDLFGNSVSISGNTAIVGTIFDDDGGSNSGSAYVFSNSGGIWSEVAKLTASDAAEGDDFGASVSISGDTAIVGAFRDDDAGSNAGSAYVFSNSGGTWNQVAKLTASDAAEGDVFGVSVSISGDTALVGAGGGDSKSAYVFANSGGIWNEVANLTASDADRFSDGFGFSVSISGDTAIVGAPWDDDGFNSYAGSAYLYDVPEPSTGLLMTLALLGLPLLGRRRR